MHGGNKLKAARELGISRCYLHRLLNQFNMTGEPAIPIDIDQDSQATQDNNLPSS
jgi:hypothetical protein